MKFIYFIGGIIGLYAPTKMLYKYFFNTQRTIPPLTLRIINSLLPYKNVNKTSFYQSQRYLNKRDAILSMTIDHQGRLQSPTIIDESNLCQKQQSFKNFFIHAIIHRNNIYLLNQDELINQVEKINKKLNLKLEALRIIECIKPLVFYKYPLIYTSQYHSLQVVEIQIYDTQNYICVKDYPAKSLFQQVPYTLEICSKHEEENIQNQNSASIEVDENDLIQKSQEGTLFLFYRDKLNGDLNCLQLLELSQNHSFCQAFKRLLSKMTYNSEEKIKFLEKKIYKKELINLIKDTEFKEIVLLKKNGLICQIDKVKIKLEEEINLKNKKIFLYLNNYQNNFNLFDSLVFDQQIF
ncbi:hypothetical protein ABPG72_004780 [Tetrahymena utriculariae]